MPWHFGGPEWLFYDEAEAYIKHYERKQKAAKAQAGQARNKRR